MDYDFGAAIAAGVVATVVMTAMLYLGMAMMPRQMPMNILYMLGSMMSRNKMMAYTDARHDGYRLGDRSRGSVYCPGPDFGSDRMGSALRVCPLSHSGHGNGHDWDDASNDARRPNASARIICGQFAQDDSGGVSYGSPCLRPGSSWSVRPVGLTRRQAHFSRKVGRLFPCLE